MVNSFINTRFSYSPLIWTFTSKGCNKRIDRTHERSRNLIIKDYESSFYDILSTLNEKTTHQHCIHVLSTKVICLNDFSSKLMKIVFYLRQNHCNLSSLNVFAMDNPRNNFKLNSTVYRANQHGKHYPLKQKTVHHCNKRTKLKLGAMVDDSDKYGQCTLPM